MAKRNTNRNAGHPLLRTTGWAAVVLALYMASHPATDRADAQIGCFLAIALAVALWTTRNK